MTYIPSTADSVKRRGFDHALETAVEVQKRSNIELVDLFKKPKSLDQRTLNRQQREKNMRDSIKIKESVTEIPKKIIIVDDVFTTGSTLNAAAHRLKECGAETVNCITFARTF